MRKGGVWNIVEMVETGQLDPWKDGAVLQSWHQQTLARNTILSWSDAGDSYDYQNHLDDHGYDGLTWSCSSGQLFICITITLKQTCILIICCMHKIVRNIIVICIMTSFFLQRRTKSQRIWQNNYCWSLRNGTLYLHTFRWLLDFTRKQTASNESINAMYFNMHYDSEIRRHALHHGFGISLYYIYEVRIQ